MFNKINKIYQLSRKGARFNEERIISWIELFTFKEILFGNLWAKNTFNHKDGHITIKDLNY